MQKSKRKNKTSSIKHIEIWREKITYNRYSVLCVCVVSSDEEEAVWSTSGCEVLAWNDTATECSCHRLSVYSLLLHSDKNQVFLRILRTAGRDMCGKACHRIHGPSQLQPKVAQIRVHNNLPTRH